MNIKHKILRLRETRTPALDNKIPFVITFIHKSTDMLWPTEYCVSKSPSCARWQCDGLRNKEKYYFAKCNFELYVKQMLSTPQSHYSRGKKTNINYVSVAISSLKPRKKWLETTLSSVSFWIKIVFFLHEYQWNVFLRTQYTKSHHWFR